MFNIKCPDIASTEALARKLASVALLGDIFLLYGTLGMGKSVFARAFIQALTDTKEVPSPTFTLVQTYEAPNFDIYHYDLYRLKSPEEIWELNIEEAFHEGVSLIEWPEKMGAYLPRTCFKIYITADEKGTRDIRIETADLKQTERLTALFQNKENIHATTVDINGNGILIIGKSGEGKSDLALRLIENKGAVLVADDRTDIQNINGKLVASCPKSIEGLLEVRGIGVVKTPFQPSTEIKLVVTSTSQKDIERYPQNSFFENQGIRIPSLLLDFNLPSAPDKVVVKLKTLLEEKMQNT